MSIRATIQTEGPFISLAFEVGAPNPDGDEPHDSRQTFGPLRMATVDDAVVLLAQFARYIARPAVERP